ncbi:hypothetical protein F3Y22_tig00112231pilonHSYRG00219 [Hibiscus syriacus]|uniref:RRM domain-containing protein n=1 Tax=Hibiscus syriacus TaxID=106335 RepID=A0A6A2X3Y4_HIBSY|nr:hypothetical protein F3Y22_tig00112231pilonHSYRG00219 [Hibiscus syriacus]
MKGRVLKVWPNKTRDSRKYVEVVRGEKVADGFPITEGIRMQEKAIRPEEEWTLEKNMALEDVARLKEVSESEEVQVVKRDSEVVCLSFTFYLDLSLVGLIKENLDLEFAEKALESEGFLARVVRWGNTTRSCIVSFLSHKRVSRRVLRDFFSPYGQILRIFIPHCLEKSNYKSTTFAFVQFADEERVAKYHKASRREVDVGKRTLGSMSGKYETSNTRRNALSMKIFRDDRLYKEVVQSDTNMIRVQVSGSNLDGVKKKASGGRNVWELYIPTGYAWKACFITFESIDEFSYVWENKKVELSSCFDWSPPVLNENGDMGRFICFKEESKNRSDLSSVKVLLRVESPFDVPEMAIVGSYGRSFKLKIFISERHASSSKSKAGTSHCGSLGFMDNRTSQLGNHLGMSLRELFFTYENAQPEDNEVTLAITKDLRLPRPAYNIKWTGEKFILQPNNSSAYPMLEVEDVDSRLRRKTLREEKDLIQGEQDVQLDIEQSCGQRSSHGNFVSGNNPVGPKKIKMVMEDHLCSSKEIFMASSENPAQALYCSNISTNQRKLRVSPSHSGSVCSVDEVTINFFDRVYRRVIGSMVRDSLEHVRDHSQSSQEFAEARMEVVATREENKLNVCRTGLRRKLGANLLRCGSSITADGSAGGLMCLWNEDLFEFSTEYKQIRFMALTGKLKLSNFECVIINVYGPSVETDKEEFFKEFLCFVQSLNLPVLRGDSLGAISESLQLGMLPKSLSDHNPMVLVEECNDWGPKPFRFFNYLLEGEGFTGVVENSFLNLRKDNGCSGLFTLLKGIKQAIRNWPRSYHRGISEDISELEAKINDLELKFQSGGYLFRKELLGTSRKELCIGRVDNLLRLTHLQFADDLILFYKDSPTQILNIRRVLRVFSLMSGLDLNLSKSKLYGVNLEKDILRDCAFAAGCGVGVFPMTYLGLPIGTIKISELLWEPVIQNFYTKLAGWKASTLSMAGRLILVKVVLSSLSIFYLSIFIIPPKVVTPQDSWIWRGFMNNYEKNDAIGDYLGSNSKIQVGNGRSIAFWNDVWVNNSTLKFQFPRIFALSTNKWGIVVDFVDDFLAWSRKGDCMFSVKSCRLVLSCITGGNYQWNKWVWSGFAPPRVQTFLWQLSHHKVAIRVELRKRGVPVDNVLCPLCLKEEETIQHLFILCPVAGELWNKFLRFISGVVLWSVWKARNSMVFESWNFDSALLFFISRFSYVAKQVQDHLQQPIFGLKGSAFVDSPAISNVPLTILISKYTSTSRFHGARMPKLCPIEGDWRKHNLPVKHYIIAMLPKLPIKDPKKVSSVIIHSIVPCKVRKIKSLRIWVMIPPQRHTTDNDHYPYTQRHISQSTIPTDPSTTTEDPRLNHMREEEFLTHAGQGVCQDIFQDRSKVGNQESYINCPLRIDQH